MVGPPWDDVLWCVPKEETPGLWAEGFMVGTTGIEPVTPTMLTATVLNKTNKKAQN